MTESISIFQHTQKSYSEAVFAQFKRGRLHAMQLYAEWFRYGSIEGIWSAIEPQAIKLVEEMVSVTDFTLPGISGDQMEGETVKFLLRFSDGLESESVLIPMEAGKTLCLSSQVGCRMGCSFCETGKMGLIRHLTTKEIVAQVFTARFKLGAVVRNLVFMGMGEPLDNYDAVMQAVRVLTDPAGMAFGPSRITISTSGKVEEIYRLIEDADPALNLAVSVNAPTDQVRSKLMPVNHTWDMGALKQAMLAYCNHPRREILVEYVLIRGVNDGLDHADLLAQYLEGIRARVNLIPYNPQRRDRYLPPESADKEAFLQRMRDKGYQTMLRGTKGQKIQAACGQLGNVEVRRQLIEKRSLPLVNSTL